MSIQLTLSNNNTHTRFEPSRLFWDRRKLLLILLQVPFETRD